MTIKAFRRWKPANAPAFKRVKQFDQARGSARDRGYDRDWERARLEYLKSVDGICEEHQRRGYLVPAVLVDHMVPVREAPDRRLDKTNFDALCRNCHDGWKRKLEAYARRSNAISLLPRWVKHPETRPIHFQIRCEGPFTEAR